MTTFDDIATECDEMSDGMVELTFRGDGRQHPSHLFLGVDGFTGEDTGAMVDALVYDAARKRLGF